MMNQAVATLVEDIKQNYVDYTSRNGTRELSQTNKDMIAEFKNGFEVSAGRKYIKIVCGRSVWGFIVATDSDKKFKKGDVLKAASWSAPTRNFARGNVIIGGYNSYWTGAS
jgi:hypothetical protein